MTMIQIILDNLSCIWLSYFALSLDGLTGSLAESQRDRRQPAVLRASSPSCAPMMPELPDSWWRWCPLRSLIWRRKSSSLDSGLLHGWHTERLLDLLFYTTWENSSRLNSFPKQFQKLAYCYWSFTVAALWADFHLIMPPINPHPVSLTRGGRRDPGVSCSCSPGAPPSAEWACFQRACVLHDLN